MKRKYNNIDWSIESRAEVRKLENEFSALYREKCGVNEKNLIEFGDMNYIVQCDVFIGEDGKEHVEYDQYQPRKNRVWHGYDDISKEQLIANLKDTKERIKMLSDRIDMFIENVESGKQDFIYYWEDSLEMKEKYVEEHLNEKYFKL